MDLNKIEQMHAMELAPFMKQNGLETETKPSNSRFRNLSLYFSQYCDSTSIHGIKYVGQRGRYLLENLIWLIIVICVCTTCLLLIHKTYRKWQTSPVIVTFATTETPISDIPFPAVTICPQAKFDPDVFNFTSIVLKKMVGDELDESENVLFDTLSMICSDSGQLPEIMDLDDANKTLEDYMMLSYFLALPQLDPTNLTSVKWLGKELEMMHALSQTFTSDGICYTFNMLPYGEVLRDVGIFISQNTKENQKVERWSLDKGYPSSNYMDSYPRRTFLAGMNGGLLVDALFTNNTHLDYLCDQSIQGYKIVLHHPCELPNMEKSFLLPLDEAVFVGIKPKMITVSEDLMDYKPEDRKCYFSDEKYLSMYRHYTQENCLSECLANFTMAECGCVTFYMPTTTKTQLCGLGSFQCVQRSKVQFLENDSKEGGCGCFPPCTSLSYEMETSQTNWNWRKIFEVFRKADLSKSDAKQLHFSRLNVYYKDLHFLSSERNELYGYVDFFSNVGGLLGLFIGFSVTSAIEILYFLTLRLVCNIIKYGKNIWSGEPELINSTDD